MQVVGLCVSVAVPASLGSAYAVSAADAVQDAKITHIEIEIAKIDAKLSQTRDIVIVMQPQVEEIKRDVSKIDETLRTILEHVE